MPLRNNPFKPNKPVHPGLFTGRINEITKIENALFSTIDDNPNHLLFIGERGIGKTSLLILARYLSTGEIPLNRKEKFNFLTIYLSLDRSTTKTDLCKKIVRQLEREFRKDFSKLQLIKDIWKFVQRVEIAGTKVQNQSIDDSEVLDNLIYSLSDTLKQIVNHNDKDGIVFLLDETDSCNKDVDLGLVVKKITEELALENINRILFILCGLPITREILKESHPSSLRIFEEINLQPLTKTDCTQVIKTGLKEANEKNEIKVNIDDEALDLIAFFSEGYPHFIQQFGYCAYEIDTDNMIDKDDVNAASYNALSLIGDRYYKDLFYEKINKDSYRQILRIMAEKLDSWVTKQDIRKSFKGKNTTLDNAINALYRRNIILRKQGTRGEYKLQWMGFALWIKFFTEE